MQAGEEEYDPQFHTADNAVEDAELIYEKGQGQWGTNEKAIFKVVCASPPEHLMNVNQAYADKYGYTLIKAMEKELGGNVGEAMNHVLLMKLKPYEAIAAPSCFSCRQNE